MQGVPTVCSVHAYSWKTCEFSDEKPFGRLQETFISVIVSLFLFFEEGRQQHRWPRTDGSLIAHWEHGAARDSKTHMSYWRSSFLLKSQDLSALTTEKIIHELATVFLWGILIHFFSAEFKLGFFPVWKGRTGPVNLSRICLSWGKKCDLKFPIDRPSAKLQDLTC